MDQQKNSSPSFYLLLLFVFLWTGLSASASTSMSDYMFEHRASISRGLLQAKKACPLNFETMNYTIITSQCKSPQYPPNLCCPAFKEFACPYANELNNLTNDCATTMFSYINLRGNYPPDLFASLCREGKEGIPCPATPPSSLSESVNPSGSESGSGSGSGSQIMDNPSPLSESLINPSGSKIISSNPSPLLLLTMGLLVLLLRLF